MVELNIKHTSSRITLLKLLARYPEQLDAGSKMVQCIHCLEALVHCLVFFLITLITVTLGSVYLLTILATVKARTLVGQVKGDQALWLAALIRCPSPGAFNFQSTSSTTLLTIVYHPVSLLDMPEGRMVIQSIIPAITKLRQLFNIKMTNLLLYHLLLEQGLPLILEASNLRVSDKLFDNISYKLAVKFSYIYPISDISSLKWLY